ncbi:MAG: aconitase X catalytic domain-containing protein [Conexivisphaerales archaeon]
MYLTNQEEKALNGEFGEAIATSYRVLLSLGEFLGADRLIPITSAHISGVNYANIGEEGLNFIEKVSQEGRVSVKTTLNPCGIELSDPFSLNPPADFVERQKKIIDSYMKMGVSGTLTCVPYEFDNRPKRGSHIAWAESSASIYANSVLGAMTNRESAISSLAAAIAGKTPNAGMHIAENRKPGLIVSVSADANLETTADYGLLGLFAGKLTQKPIGFTGLRRSAKHLLKALGAGIGTSGSSPMFMLLDSKPKNVEEVPYTQREKQEMKESTTLSSDPDMVLLGCPFYTFAEVKRLASAVSGRKAKKKIYLHLSRSVYEKAKNEGAIGKLEKAGIKVLRDVCPSLTPIGAWNGMNKVITDSAKGSFYMRTALKYNVGVLDLEAIVKSYT